MCQLFDNNPHVLAAIDITDVLGTASAIGVDQQACPFLQMTSGVSQIHGAPANGDFHEERQGLCQRQDGPKVQS